MADTNYTRPPLVAIPLVDTRDGLADRVRSDATRVPAVEQQPATSRQTGRSPDETAAELERLARDALHNSRLSIQRETDKGDFIYLMIDEDTGETVRRWPPESRLELIEYLRTFKAGLVNRTA